MPPLVLIVLVLGSIFGGIASPTEAAAMGAFGGLVLAVIYRSFSLEMLKDSVYLTAKATAMLQWTMM